VLNLEMPDPSIATGGTPPFRPEPGFLFPLPQPSRPFLGRLKAALTCALLAASTGLVLEATLLVHAATQATRGATAAISAELRATRADLNAQLAATREGLTGEIATTRRNLLASADRQIGTLLRDTLREVDTLRTDVVGEVDQIRATADRRVGDALARTDTAIATVQGLREDVKPLLAHAGSVAKQVDDSAPLFLDCEFNPDCFFNRYVGASKGIERAAMNFGQMSLDFQNALPTAIKTWEQIGGNVAGITDNVNRLTKPRWYDRLLGYGLNGVVIYRNLNPATNLTTRPVQFIASRP